MTGILVVNGAASDEKFNMIAKGHPILKRKVEVCCWEEIEKPITERQGDTVQSDVKYDYRKVWCHSEINSDLFVDKQKINVQKTLQN